MIAAIVVGVALSIFYVLFSAIRNLARTEAQIDALHAEIARRRKQAEVMVENRTPDDAVDRLDDGGF